MSVSLNDERSRAAVPFRSPFEETDVTAGLSVPEAEMPRPLHVHRRVCALCFQFCFRGFTRPADTKSIGRNTELRVPSPGGC